MKRTQTHFSDTGKPPIRKIGTIGGDPTLIYKSLCGTCDRDTTTDVRGVTCLLCLRSILAVIKRHAIDFGSRNPQLTNNLFPEVIRDFKRKRSL